MNGHVGVVSVSQNLHHAEAAIPVLYYMYSVFVYKGTSIHC